MTEWGDCQGDEKKSGQKVGRRPGAHSTEWSQRHVKEDNGLSGINPDDTSKAQSEQVSPGLKEALAVFSGILG